MFLAGEIKENRHDDCRCIMLVITPSRERTIHYHGTSHRDVRVLAMTGSQGFETSYIACIYIVEIHPVEPVPFSAKLV